MDSEPHPYLSLVVSRTSPEVADWLRGKLEQLDPRNFSMAYAGAGRRLGDACVVLNADERARLEAAGLVLPTKWRLSDVGRSLLLHRVCQRLAMAEQPEFVAQVYNKGDNKEREALLKTLVGLPEPERFSSTAIDACRSHVQSVFEAIACENRYPGKYFPDAAFNQLVLKAFFTQVRVERIAMLAERRTPELGRMANAYADERRAAGRPVPPDLELVTQGSS